MSILDTLERDPEVREILRASGRRRMHYLEGRAAWRAEQPAEASDADRATEDQTVWARATLWLEAVETALFMGDVDNARHLLPFALAELDALGHPLGAALRQAFSPEIRNTGRTFARPLRSDPPPSVRVWAGFLAPSGITPRFDERRDGPTGPPLLAPVGRMGVPEADVLKVARWRNGLLDGPRNDPRDADEDLHTGTAAVLNRLLDRQYMALSQERYNTHLWHRLLVRAPLFDLELAVLLAAGLERHDSRASPAALAAQSLLPEARSFGQACLDLVASLRG